MIKELTDLKELAKAALDYAYDLFGGAAKTGIDVLIGDRLLYYQVKNRVRLVQKLNEYYESINLPPEKRIPLSFKTGIPLIENACMEDDPELQDIWINLIANSTDPNFKDEVRTAYIDIAKGLNPLDARILKVIYKDLNERFSGSSGKIDIASFFTNEYHSFKINLAAALKICYLDIEISVNNLYRLNCLSHPALMHPASEGHGAGRTFAAYNTGALTHEAIIETPKFKKLDSLSDLEDKLTDEYNRLLGHLNTVIITPLGYQFVKAASIE